jgi:uncharacterized alkaline shock family protein YloU
VVVSKIPELAAREVPGVHELVWRGIGAAVCGLAQRVTRADARSTGVNVEVAELEATLDLLALALLVAAIWVCPRRRG